MRIAVIIPARYGSTRFPGKPLVEVRGASMIRRVMAIGHAAEGVDRVVVATDDHRIADHVKSFGGEAVMTPEHCRNGTERAYAASLALGEKPDVVINLQGDAILTPPWIISAIAKAMLDDPELEMSTPATRMDKATYERFKQAKAAGDVGGTTVVTRLDGYAMYFSKALIPFLRNAGETMPVMQHVGLYAYRFETLAKLVALPPSPLEEIEGLEQLRALENGVPIKVVEIDYRGRSHASIDSPADVAVVERLIDAEGELAPL
ncbi:MAG: 3-deoxy-manno-octulosonate cytidylyltransferase [Caulobacterales bacterium]